MSDQGIALPTAELPQGPLWSCLSEHSADQEAPLSAAPKEQDKGASMVEDVLKGNSRAGPDENNRLQVDVRFLDRERLGEVAGAAVARGDFLKLGKLLGADALRDRAARVESAAGRRIQR